MVDAPFRNKKAMDKCARIAFANLMQVVKVFLISKNRLKTVRVTFGSSFEGQVDSMRVALEGLLGRGDDHQPVLMKDKHNV